MHLNFKLKDQSINTSSCNVEATNKFLWNKKIQVFCDTKTPFLQAALLNSTEQ